MPETIRLHAEVSGRVQGVGFRYYVVDHAVSLGLTGWVRNRWDGSVEVISEGDRQSQEKLLNALKRGPRSAFVADVNYEWLPETGEFKQFSIRLSG